MISTLFASKTASLSAYDYFQFCILLFNFVNIRFCS